MSIDGNYHYVTLPCFGQRIDYITGYNTMDSLNRDFVMERRW